MQMSLSLPASGPTTPPPTTPPPTTNSNTNTTSEAGSTVYYRVGLNPVQQATRDFVANMTGAEVQAFVDAFRKEVTEWHLHPVFPKAGTTAALLTEEGEAYFTPNDLVEHAGLHADTVDKYLHNYIGVWANAPNYKQERMTRLHADAPWGRNYAAHLTEPLPLRLVSARALVFIVMAPTSVYRPTTGDKELTARHGRLVRFRVEAQGRFGVPKGAPKRIDTNMPTTTSVRRKPMQNARSNKTSEDTTPMPIPALFTLPLPIPTACDLDEAIADLCGEDDTKGVAAPAQTPHTDKSAFGEVPDLAHPSLVDGAVLDTYFAAVADLRARAEKLRGLLDLLPAQEVDDRVAEFFRAGLNVLDKGRMA